MYWQGRRQIPAPLPGRAGSAGEKRSEPSPRGSAGLLPYTKPSHQFREQL
jgi:hypothetical protein